MKTSQVREKFLNFMKREGHTIIPSSSIIPENDATTLFTGSGMQPLVPYLLGQDHPSGSRLANSQKCLRAEDIEDVGDNRHTTFFEMLGNWSLGDYFKEKQITQVFSFLVDEIGIDPQKLYVSVYAGDSKYGIEKDVEAVSLWKSLFKEKGIDAIDIFMGSEEEAANLGMNGGRIFYYRDKNWWSRAGVPSKMPKGEPGGPDCEMFYEFDSVEHDPSFGVNCHPNCDCGRFLEIGNSVFMQYLKNDNDTFSPLPRKNVDFGGGLERIVAASQNESDVFKIDALYCGIKALGEIMVSYPFNSKINPHTAYDYPEKKKLMRVVVDHIRASVFIMSEGVVPKNTDKGYVLRRLIRRAVRFAKDDVFVVTQLSKVAEAFIDYYGEYYTDLVSNKDFILKELLNEIEKFNKTLIIGEKELQKILANLAGQKVLSGESAFKLYESFGFPIELTQEICSESGVSVDLNSFNELFAKHKESSKLSMDKRFKGGLSGNSEVETRYHSATHLLQSALRKVLGNHISQKGSNITPERMRFDFSHDEKMTIDELVEVENLVNENIEKSLPVSFKEMSIDEARAIGAIGVFGDKYGERVKIYSIGDDQNGFVSRELCGGPHVENTSQIGKFKIVKEEAVSAGVRRIKAVLG